MKTEPSVNDLDMLSALADGQLRGAAFAQAVESVLHSEEARSTWHCYQVIGDVLRSGDLAAQCGGDQAFLARFQSRLKDEPQVSRPMAQPMAAQVAVAYSTVERMAPAGGRADARQEAPAAANAPVFRWKMVAGFASMAAVAAIGWNLLALPGASGIGGGQQLAAVPASARVAVAEATPQVQRVETVKPVAVADSAPSPAAAQNLAMTGNEPQVMIRDRRLDELMAAHKQFGGTSALQMPAGFLRNATFEAPAR